MLGLRAYSTTGCAVDVRVTVGLGPTICTVFDTRPIETKRRRPLRSKHMKELFTRNLLQVRHVGYADT